MIHKIIYNFSIIIVFLHDKNQIVHIWHMILIKKKKFNLANRLSFHF
jgi:hypothetical protein